MSKFSSLRRGPRRLLALLLTAGALVLVPAMPAQADCPSIPPDRDLAVTQIVYQVGSELGVSDKVMLAGFETGWVESRMNNLNCGDQDSLGVFQQRPSQGWGTPAQIMDVRFASNSFFTRAKNSEAANPGFTAGQISQDVQRSAHPDRYDAAESKARSMMAEVAIQRFAFVNSGAGQVFAKDGSHSPWPGALNGGGASKVVLSGQWIGIMTGDTFWAKSGINGAWKLMASGAGMRDIAIDGDRFAFVNSAGQVLVKDGADSPWSTPINGGDATKVVLDDGWIGVLQGGGFLAKFGIFGGWKVMAGGPDVVDVAIDGNRFAFVNSAGFVFAKDGADSPWPGALNGGGATRVELESGWIGVIQGGSFLAKFDIFGTWKTLADGGAVTDITLGRGGWFGFIGSGSFFAKQGADNGWLTMAGGGQVRDIAIET
ncbi:hypothetical protein GCM10009554_00420 [Kribbella koreensis]|uniref:Mannosyl-glycoprotein endo-beta-N-acetylglucosaminidase n=1 Tax=Kribbella koreensis TaxID=57909 RepID=A0ABP3ZK98_9ACTN